MLTFSASEIFEKYSDKELFRDMSFISWAIDQGWQQGVGPYNTTYPVPG